MKAIELEAWTLKILERVEKRVPVEDMRVEIKSAWLDPVKAARRIAAHANAARGEDILWLIGADEKQGQVDGANYNDLANWWPQVKACFESVVPALQDLNVTYNGKTVAVLCFGTSRFPFVVKNPKGGEIQFEVPWRDGTSVRSATHGDLILMLSPMLKMPKVILLNGHIQHRPRIEIVGERYDLRLLAYIVPKDNFPVTFPFFKCSATISAGSNIIAQFGNLSMRGSPTPFDTHWSKMAPGSPKNILRGEAIVWSRNEIVVRSAGAIEIDGSLAASRHKQSDELELTLSMVEAVSDVEVRLSGTFTKVMLDNEWVWKLAGKDKPR